MFWILVSFIVLLVIVSELMYFLYVYVIKVVWLEVSEL